MDKCPFPKCQYSFNYLTKLHCEAHGMTKTELLKKYGNPIPVRVSNVALRENMKMTNPITQSKYRNHW